MPIREQESGREKKTYTGIRLNEQERDLLHEIYLYEKDEANGW